MITLVHLSTAIGMLWSLFVVTPLIEALSEYLNVNIFLLFTIMWMTAGIFGALIYKYCACGPCSLFGDKHETNGFWTVFLWGPFGAIGAFIATLDYMFEQRGTMFFRFKIKSKNIISDYHEVEKRSRTTGLPLGTAFD